MLRFPNVQRKRNPSSAPAKKNEKQIPHDNGDSDFFLFIVFQQLQNKILSEYLAQNTTK